MPKKKHTKWNFQIEEINMKLDVNLQALLNNTPKRIINIKNMENTFKNDFSENIKFRGKRVDILQCVRLIYGTIENWIDVTNDYVILYKQGQKFVKYYENDDIYNDWEIINIPNVSVFKFQ
jgi:hypothetical protein